MVGHTEAMEDLRNTLTARESLYAKADAVVDTSGSAVEKTFEALREVVRAGRSGDVDNPRILGANWISPPSSGINEQPVECQYVRFN